MNIQEFDQKYQRMIDALIAHECIRHGFVTDIVNPDSENLQVELIGANKIKYMCGDVELFSIELIEDDGFHFHFQFNVEEKEFISSASIASYLEGGNN